jgi:hypothetical protein
MSRVPITVSVYETIHQKIFLFGNENNILPELGRLLGSNRGSLASVCPKTSSRRFKMADPTSLTCVGASRLSGRFRFTTTDWNFWGSPSGTSTGFCSLMTTGGS